VQTPPPASPIQTSTFEPGVIPAGTTFSIRTNEEIQTAQAGQTFMAQVEQETGVLSRVTFFFLLAAPLTVAVCRIAQPDVSGSAKGNERS
jgi:hypothetical protein